MVLRRAAARRFVAIAGAVSTVLAVSLAAASGEASVGKPAADRITTLSAKPGSTVVRTGQVDLTTLPRASAGSQQKLTPGQMSAVNRPLKSATQLATYRQWVLSHASQLPQSAGAPAPRRTNFISSNRQIPQLEKDADGINFTQSGCGCTPPDQAVGVSSSQVFEGVNNLLQVYNSSLATIYGPVTAQSFFGPLFHSGDFFSDPQITYNPTKGRWVIAWLEINSNGTADYIDLAVSKTSSPNPTTFYEYQVPANVSGANDFCDYPTLGYENNAAWVSCVTFNGSSGAFVGNRVFGFPFTQVDAGSLSNYVWFYNIPTDVSCGSGCVYGAYRLSPAIEDGSAQGEFVTATDAGFGVTSKTMTVCALTNTIAIQKGSIPKGTCTYTSTPLAYDDPVSAPQPGTSALVYPGVGTKQLAYRDGRLWFAMPVAVSCGGTAEDGIWWGDVVPQLTAISSGYPQTMNGVVSSYSENAYWCYSGGVYSYMPSIVASSEGDAALVFSLSASSTYFPGIAYTGRMAADPPNTMGSVGANAFAVAGSADNTTGRYGDYSACALITGAAIRGTAWCGGEYGGSDVWNTRLYELRMQ
jgi:hypothetical protein